MDKSLNYKSQELVKESLRLVTKLEGLFEEPGFQEIDPGQFTPGMTALIDNLCVLADSFTMLADLFTELNSNRVEKENEETCRA